MTTFSILFMRPLTVERALHPAREGIRQQHSYNNQHVHICIYIYISQPVPWRSPNPQHPDTHYDTLYGSTPLTRPP